MISMKGTDVARPTLARAAPGYRLFLRYDDGTEGEVDLSSLVGRGVFKAWQDVAFFQSVKLGPYGEIMWGDQIDLCPDAMYLRLTRRTPEQVFPALKKAGVEPLP
jgi:hypothetical protein